jgi:hypothetical protein
MGSVAEQETNNRCALCGKLATRWLAAEQANVPLCGSCAHRVSVGDAGVSHWQPTENELPAPPEERFDELFRAARILLNEGVADENQIIPTLALANELGQGLSEPIAAKERLKGAVKSNKSWEHETAEFVSRYGSLRPVWIVDDVLILERLPISVVVDKDSGTGVVEEVTITVYAQRQLAEPRYVGSRYEEVLESAHLPHDESKTARLGFTFQERHLVITVQRVNDKAAPTWQGTLAFPHPRVVQEFYRMLIGKFSGDGFARYLAARERGGAPLPDNLIPACVAFYLREYGEIGGRKEVHRLLDEHVLANTWKKLPQDGYGSSATYQLWKDVNNPAKVGNPLMDVAYTLWSGGQ